MVLNGNECSNALYNANHRELHVSTLMGFWFVGMFCTLQNGVYQSCMSAVLVWILLDNMLIY